MNSSFIERDLNTIWHPYTQRGLEVPPLLITRAHGSHLFSHDGKAYIDAISSWWVALHGHSHPYITKKIQQQSEEMHHVIFAGCTHPPAIELAEKLLKLVPDSHKKIFFTDNGSSAVEASIKMALQFWQNSGQPKKNRFVSLNNGYHGDTLGAMSVSGKTVFNRPFHDLLFNTTQIPLPGDSLEEALTILEQELKKGVVAAFIYEPLLQGAAGMKLYSPAALDACLALCKAYDVITIADEVFTGFYKTGLCFASDHCATQPDIIVLSKALTAGSLPLAVLSVTDRLHDAFISDSRENMFLHGHTFTANPLACVTASASIDLMDRPEFQQQVSFIRSQHSRFVEKLSSCSEVEAVRTIGMLLAFEVKTDSEAGYTHSIRDTIYTFCLERGVFLRPLGNTIYVLPPAVITGTDLNRVFLVLEEFLDYYASLRR